MKNILVTLLRYIIIILIFQHGIVVKGIAVEKTFVNKPWQTLTDEEKLQNMSYIASVTKQRQETMDSLIALLSNPQTCFLPREAIKRHGREAVEMLQKLLLDDFRPLVVRSEALSILVELGEYKTAKLIEKDRLFRTPVTAYEEVYRSPLYTFQMQYVNLRLHGLKRNEMANVLTRLLEEESCTYIVKKKLVLLGKEATPFVVQLLNNKTAPYFARLSALIVIKDLEDPKAASSVMQILQDHKETNQLRTLAAQTLGVIGNKSYVDAMLRVSGKWSRENESLYDVSDEVRKAVKALIK